MTWLVIDTEVTTTTYMKRKASPFHPDNWVVMMGWCTAADPTPRGRRYSQFRQGDLTDDFISLLASDIRLLVGQNIKFDILHIISKDDRAYEAWREFVARGGIVYDLQLAEYLLHGQDQGSHMLSMDELAVRYGCDLKVDEVKMLWEAGVDTPDIDPDLLARYLLGETLPDGSRREGDIGVTRDVFLKQIKAVGQAQLTNLIRMEMGALVATIEMEFNGLYVDKELGMELRQELLTELTDARKELEAFLPADLPFEFNWGNRYMLSPLLFGGTVKYQRRQYDVKGGGRTWDAPTEDTKELYVYAHKRGFKYVFGS